MRQVVKKVIAVSFCISFMFLSLATRAESDVDSFVQFKIASLQVFSSFSSFIYFQGDERNRTRLLNAKNQGDKAISAFPDSEVNLKLKWQKISEYVESYQNHDFDGSDMSLEAGWSILQRELNEIINARETHKLKRIDDVQIKMESILSQYMAYANSTTGGYGVSYGDAPLEVQIMNIKEDLANLVQAEPKYKPLLKKWGFIQGALLAYNSNVAPFIVLHTYDGMRKMIASY